MARNPFPKQRVKTVRAGGVRLGGGAPLALMAGPCVIESREMALDLAGRLARLAKREGIPLIFKASYDKANRSSIKSFRGPGLARGLEILAEVKERFGLPILVDVHQVAEVGPAAEVADILQLPAFLCRQTDLAVALGESGRVVNIKKGQFLAPWDMRHVIEKVESTGNRKILLTERGVSFGYNNLVADFRSLLALRQFGYPVVFDATHSLQLPGGKAEGTGGDSRWAPYLSRAAVATGCDALFWETHPNPEEAKSDKDNTLPLELVGPLWRQCRSVDELLR
ncbi:MAG: 3-deoxy-8-phosphooctulonate synthase [Lentisphaerae bacterium]|jgi:2-dehydro-3-deoxyphosphooctonate aldolase (KDO 8-P synthase)|nr:3-deoxy-8-phosphooctulonate synthase [Lentisphaerota bacterium]